MEAQIFCVPIVTGQAKQKYVRCVVVFMTSSVPSVHMPTVVNVFVERHKVKRILLDLDSTIADLMSPWLEAYNSEYGDTLTKDSILSWAIENHVKPECGVSVFKYLRGGKLYADGHVKPMDGAIDVVERLSHDYELVIVTATIPDNAPPKIKWIHDNLPMVPKKNIVLTDRKDLIVGDFLVDDGAHNIASWQHGLPVLFDQPWNRDCNVGLRALSWLDVERIIYAMK